MGEDGLKDEGISKRKIIFALFLIACLGAALTVGLVLHFAKPITVYDTRSDVIVNCLPEKDGTEAMCVKRGCEWMLFKDENLPRCRFPSAYGYKMVGEANVTSSGMLVELERLGNKEYLTGSAAINNLYVSIEYRSDESLRIRIYPKTGTRWEIPNSMIDIPSTISTDDSGHLYKVDLVKEPQFGITVMRKATNQTIWNSTLPGFVYSDQFLQMSTRLASDNFYGLGEHNHRRFKHNMNWKTWTIFTRDVGPIDEWNLYGAHPTYLNVEDNDGNSHMVFLKNSNAMEVDLQPSPHPAVTFRTIGGVLDFYIFLGPSPGEAVSQYTQAIGHPVMPPYWTLGFHICRWGYANITHMRNVIDRNRAAGIPYDAQWGDIDLMYDKFLFSYDRRTWDGLPDLVRDLHNNHQKFVVIVDPGVGIDPNVTAEIQKYNPGYNMFNDGVTKGIFVLNPNNSGPIIGEVWPGKTAYPDFSNPKTEGWWQDWATYFYNSEDIKYDSLWIDMNEPSSFVPGSVNGCEKNKLNNPPFAPNILGSDVDNRLYDKTICMDAKHFENRTHYDIHSLYAHTESIQTYNALAGIMPGKRPWTMTRSSFAGTGKYATKWMGDNQARWENMKWSIVGILEFGLFGFSLNGADICGFWYEAEYEMCIRWHQLGAFYPFARNHNGRGDDGKPIFKDQDPGAWDDKFQRLVRQVLLTRYKLLPYYYTLLYLANTKGHTVMRPLLFEFASDNKTFAIDEQFLIGPGLLISPVLSKGQTKVKAYFPKARWYEYFSGEEVSVKGGHMELDTPLEKFNLHVRGGYVIPWQLPSTTTAQSRNNSMGAIIALDDAGKAQGELFWDDGETQNGSYIQIKFEMPMSGKMTFTPTTNNGFTDIQPLDMLDIYGLETVPGSVTVDGTQILADQIRLSQKIVQLTDLKLDLTKSHTITWLVS